MIFGPDRSHWTTYTGFIFHTWLGHSHGVWRRIFGGYHNVFFLEYRYTY